MNKNFLFKISKNVFNSVYIPSLECDKRYLIFYGGAGSGKSYFIAQRYIVKLLREKICNLLVVRAVANTNRVSTFALFKQVVSKWNLTEYFKFFEGEMKIKCLLNGNEVVFKGLDDSEKLKSITFCKGELTDIWLEEASEVSDEKDFNQLDVRLRGKGTKKQIVVSFNPVDVNHWLKKKFFDKKNNQTQIFHTTYKDNRFLDDEYVKLLEGYKKTDPYYYSVYCLGVWGVFGNTVFCASKIQERISKIKKPLKTGYFSYEEKDGRLINIEFIEDKSGFIKIYKEPEKNHPYVIGGDTAGEGSDSFTGQVLCNLSGEQCAVLKHKVDEDLYARQMYCLGKYYNEALIGIESNFSTYPIKELERLKYKKQYVREKEDSFTKKITNSLGFKTTSLTRPVIIANLVKITREDINLINDEETLLEMLTFVRNSHGRCEAKAGAHDDLVMALAIAFYIRNQQSFIIKEERENEFDIAKAFGIEEKSKIGIEPIGEEVRII